MKIILAGATGLVGSHVLKLALASSEVDKVIALARHPLPEHPKLLCVQVDYEKLPGNAEWWHADAVICTLGTTIRTAGSPQAFERVDHDYPLMVAEHAWRTGVSTYVLNSALGADPQSKFLYSRTKGRVERDLREVGFRSLTIARPGLIGGKRNEFRFGERIAIAALTVMAPMLPRQWHTNPAENIALKLFKAALNGKPGLHVIQSGEMA